MIYFQSTSMDSINSELPPETPSLLHLRVSDLEPHFSVWMDSPFLEIFLVVWTVYFHLLSRLVQETTGDRRRQSAEHPQIRPLLTRNSAFHKGVTQRQLRLQVFLTSPLIQ